MIDSVDKKILELIDKRVFSGEKLAEELGITRTAVWKRVKKLRNLGYNIESRGNGYILKNRTELLLENEVRPFLKTSFIGKKYVFFKEIDSTNTYARKSVFEDGTVVLAQKQSSGRGRRGRKWVSSGKGLYFSIVLKPSIPVSEVLKFSLIFPLSILDALSKFGINSKIKWPNDIYINGKKVSGILIESDTEGEITNRAVVGIGINVNDSLEDIKEIRDIATSLHIETGRTFDRKLLLSEILFQIEQRYISFLTGKRDETLKDLEKNMLWIGEDVVLIDGNSKTEGRLIGLNSYGGIRLKTKNGILDVFSGDISLRKVDDV